MEFYRSKSTVSKKGETGNKKMFSSMRRVSSIIWF